MGWGGDWGKRAGGWVGDKIGGEKGREIGEKVGGGYQRAQTATLTGGFSEFGGGKDPHNQDGKQLGMGPGEVAYQQTPGLQQGTPLEGDYDLSGAGAAEQQWQNSQAAYNTPGAGMQWWQQNQGQFGQPTASGEYNAQFQDKSGNLSANMDPYFARARERSVADIDKSFGGRGMYGSSAATGAIGQAVTDLNAQQAQAEAQYGLDRAAEQRQWANTGGNLAMGADQANLSQLLGGGQMAFGADQSNLNQLNSAMNAAGGAQNARENRVQNMFNNVSAPGMALFGMQQDYYPQMMQTDEGLMDSSVMMETGMAQDMVNQDRYEQDAYAQDAELAGSVFGKIFGMGG